MTDPKRVQEILLERINALCREKGITYYMLSHKSSIPITTLLHIIDGTSKNPGIFTIMKICDGLGVTLREFFDTKDFDDALVEMRYEN